VNSFRDSGYPFGTSTYYERLHRGHKQIELLMIEIKANRAELLKKLQSVAI
jgi:hypothetical protein